MYGPRSYFHYLSSGKKGLNRTQTRLCNPGAVRLTGSRLLHGLTIMPQLMGPDLCI